ncbi:DUF6542 domain-containing protein [Streptomyces sp. NPDC002643]
MPNPRLTGLGCGLFSGMTMFALACLDRLLFGASPAVYGVLFLLVSTLTAAWVRQGDLTSGPVVVPIAFAAGLPPIAGAEGGLGAHLMALVTALAMQAGWLYGGTLIAGLIVTVRKLRLMAHRAADREDRERLREAAMGRTPARADEGGGRPVGERPVGGRGRAGGARGGTPGGQVGAPGGQVGAPGGQVGAQGGRAGVQTGRGGAPGAQGSASSGRAGAPGGEATALGGQAGDPYDRGRPVRPRSPRPAAQPGRTVPRGY